jgi:hypothetical protein
MSKITYFKMSFSDASKAQKEVWERQIDTEFSIAAIGQEASVWTEDIVGENMLRQVLKERKIIFEESDTQQVKTGFEYLF